MSTAYSWCGADRLQFAVAIPTVARYVEHMTASIPKRRFGRTELAMPVFSGGAMRYQQSWTDVDWADITDDSQANLEKVIRHGLELGINHIETARGYGCSERQLGRILPQLPRKKIIVQTKVGPKADVSEFVQSFKTSMERLQVDHVDLLGIHGINNRETFEWTMKRNGCLAAARRFQRQGLCRFIGFSTHASPELMTETIHTDAFDYVNLHWYYVYPNNWPAVLAAKEHDMGVFIISPNDKGGKLYEPPEKLVRLCKPLAPMAFNDLYCLSRPEVHTLSIGAAKPGDYDMHARALKHLDNQALIRRITHRIDQALNDAWGRDWMEYWHVGLPEWQDMPNGINVREILRLWTYAKGLDMVGFGRMRYNLLGHGGHWFPGYMAKRFSANEMRRACRHSPFADRIPDLLHEAHDLLYDQPVKRLSRS